MERMLSMIPINVVIPHAVLDALKDVFSKTANPDYGNTRYIVNLLKQNNWEEEADWLRNNKVQYLLGLRHGFKSKEDV